MKRLEGIGGDISLRGVGLKGQRYRVLTEATVAVAEATAVGAVPRRQTLAEMKHEMFLLNNMNDWHQ